MRRRTGLEVLALCGAFSVAGCSEIREPVTGRRVCSTTWRENVEPLVEQHCTTCHGAALPAGGYSLATYLGALGNGSSGAPDAVAGDRNSRLVTAVTDPAITAHAGLPDKEAIVETLRAWVAPEGTLADQRRCALAWANSLVHLPGIINPSSDDFHGKLLANTYLFDLNVCADCHGKDFAGGAAHEPCTTCHVNGPTACDTCHGQPPESGAHAGHAQGRTTGKVISCDNCHPVPATWDAPGHIPVQDGRLQPPVVTFGTLANASPPPANRTGAATWDRSAKTCANVYCHGGVFDDARAALPLPTWAMRATPLGCTGCHGTPPTDHATQTAADGPCYFCHDRVVGPTGLPNALHIDGQVEIGQSGLTACNSCHGSDVNAAPPRDLSGNFATTAIGVGAHQSHVQGLHSVANPIGCAVCHLDVTAFDTPGHIDATAGAQVFPNGGAGTLAAADSAAVSWDPVTAECTAYCHGSGAKLSPDVAPGLNHTPVWTLVNQGQASCGSCHGIPPQNGRHSPDFTLQQCYQCHPRSIDQFGNFVFTGSGASRTTTHANGAVDVF